MDALTQAEVFALIAELNDFIEKWDPRLVTKEREYQAKRTRIVAENNAEKTHRERLTNRNVRHCHVSRPK